MFVKPVPMPDGTHRIVRDPRNKATPLPATGGFRPDNAYWVRRLNQGDVVLADPPPAPAEPVEHGASA